MAATTMRTIVRHAPTNADSVIYALIGSVFRRWKYAAKVDMALYVNYAVSTSVPGRAKHTDPGVAHDIAQSGIHVTS